MIEEVVAMRKYLFVCTLLLVGCAGNSDDATVFPYQPEPPVQPIVHHHPDIDELVISPRVVEYMDGGGGRKGANYLFRNAKPDGLTIGALSGGVVGLQIMRESGVMYDIDKFIQNGAVT